MTPGDAVYRRITWRLVPLLFTCYIFAYLDRINVGFAQLAMKADIGMSDTAYGLGVTVLFVAYVLFEVPSNLVLERIGVRRTLLRIMVGWGVSSAATMVVTTPGQFYVTRFLVGAFEAGFFPGIVLYLTYWYPSERRAHTVGLFATALALAGAIGGPVSGAVMSGLDGVLGMHGWQWLFLAEGLPSVVLGVVAYALLSDKPDDASWLSGEEKALVRDNLRRDGDARTLRGANRHASFGVALLDPRVWLFGIVFFSVTFSVYGLSFWSPTLIKGFGIGSVLAIGVISAVPYGIAALAMVANGLHSDRTGERRWHFAASALCGALGLVLTPLAAGNIPLSIAGLSLAAAGAFGCFPVFWAVPQGYLSPRAAAGGLALINSIGVTAGMVGPYALGAIKTSTGSLTVGLWLMGGLLLAGGAAMVLVFRADAPVGAAGPASCGF